MTSPRQPNLYGVRPFADATGPFFPAQSSVLDERALVDRVLCDYPLDPPLACRFLERGDSDIYRVSTPSRCVYLKVYRPPDDADAVEREGRFAAALLDRGLPCVQPVRRRDGRFASVVQAAEGKRPAIVYEQAPPPLPGDLSEDLLRHLGDLVGRLHRVADTLDDDDRPATNDNTAFFEEMPGFAQVYLTPDHAAWFAAVCDAMRRELDAFAETSPEIGPCHADLVLSNVRFDPDLERPVLFDFGNARVTWRAWELAVLRWNLDGRVPERSPRLWECFLRGYADAGRDPDPLTRGFSLMLALRQLGFICGFSASGPIRMGVCVVENGFLDEAIDRLARLIGEADVPGCPERPGGQATLAAVRRG